MDDETKKLGLQALLEQGNIEKFFDVQMREKDNNNKGQLIGSIARIADMVTQHSEGVMVDAVTDRIAKSLMTVTKEISEGVAQDLSNVEADLKALTQEENASAKAEILERIDTGLTKIRDDVSRDTLDTLDTLLTEAFPSLQEGAKMTEEEKQVLVDNAALAVESQMEALIGDYFVGNGVTVDQIKDFKDAVQSVIPEVDFTKAKINWNQLTGVPNLANMGGGGKSFLAFLNDVSVDSITNGQALVWNSTTRQFEGGNPTGTSPLTTKGDVYVYGSADARLPVGTNGQVLTAASGEATGLEWTNAGSGTVDTSGTPVANDFARFTDADTIEGRSYAEVAADLSLEIGTDVQAYDAQLDSIAALVPGTEGKMITSDGLGGYQITTIAGVRTYLNVEDGADVTGTANVTAAGALMDSELTSIADVKALDQSVVSGASPTFGTANMTDATNKRFMSDAQETVLNNTSGTNTGDEAAASTTVAGVVELATNAEVTTGTDTTRAVTPAGAKVELDKKMADLTDDTTPQLGGDLDLNGKEIGDATEFDNGNSSTADTIDFGTGNFQKSTLTGNCTYTFTAPTLKGRFQLRVIQDATGSRTVTWPAAVKWPGGTAPTLTTDASAIDIITFFWDGTNYYGVSTLDFS